MSPSTLTYGCMATCGAMSLQAGVIKLQWCEGMMAAQMTKISMYSNEETLVSQSGLRYTSKLNGSPYQGMGSVGETMSCIKCGQHKPRAKGAFKRYLHGLFFFCFDCKPEVRK